MATAHRAFKRRALTAVSLTFAALLAMPAVTGQATAQPKPNIKAAQKKLHDLTTQVDVLVQKYDKSQEDLTLARRKLAVTNKQAQAEQATFNTLHEAVAQMAAAAYKNGSTDDTGVADLMSAKDPSTMLEGLSVITALSQNRGSKLAQFVASAQRLQFDRGQAQQAIAQITQTRASLKAQRAALEKQVAKQKKLISAAGGPTPGQGTCNIQASGKALTAIRFACSKLGTPYLWGGTGPRYDCSGLTQAAWRAAGVSLPRTTYEQWTVYTRVSYNQLRPGDLVFFDASLGHMGLYLGAGKMIHAPHTGDVVKISDISSGSYRSQFQGGVHIA
ncbi:MAG: putative secreted protein [Actinomycetia bacterium]|nr:putative secreted protein [Actinomycetes bacterium]